jgi:6-pyruvoyltetrahydropterin/6-carboxytetrahydropterin synthase
MIIRKLFKFEGTHIVRDCSSELCSQSVHGHSYVVEVFLTSNKLDNGNMLVDFGLLKTTIKDFIESFDHAWSYWDKESQDFQQFVRKNSDRFIQLPISPSAEGYSLLMFYFIDLILRHTVFNNGEGKVQLTSVRVHETETGYAEAFREDLQWWDPSKFVYFSPGIKKRWSNPNMMEDLMLPYKTFVNPVIELKYNK